MDMQTTPAAPEISIRNVRLLVGASHAYAGIIGDGFSADVQLAAGKSAVAALRQAAAEAQERAQNHALRARRLEAAAQWLEQNGAARERDNG